MKKVLFVSLILMIGNLLVSCSNGLNSIVSPVSPPTATPTSVLSPTPTPLPSGYLMYAQIYHTKSTSTDLVYCSANNSWYVPPPTDTTSIQVFLSINQGGVQVEVRDASVTLTGPGGSLPVTYNSPGWEPNGGQNGFYMNKDDAYSCQTGTYVLTATTPLHSMSATFIGPGNTTIAPDGSSASWVVEGNHDYIWVGSATTFKNTYLTPVSIDANSPVVIPASAYSDGPDNYSVAVKLEYRTNQITGGSGEISFYDETDLNFTK